MNEQMEVLDTSGKPVSNVYCIGDANGMLSFSFRNVDNAVSDPEQEMWLV